MGVHENPPEDFEDCSKAVTVLIVWRVWFARTHKRAGAGRGSLSV